MSTAIDNARANAAAQLAARQAIEDKTVNSEASVANAVAGSPAQPLEAALHQNPNVSVFEENPAEKAHPAMKTYVHQVAGANTVMPDGKKLVFGGKTGRVVDGAWRHGGFGYYSTDIAAEIQWLEDLVKSPTSQVTRAVEDPVTHTEVIQTKRIDPAIRLAAQDAAANSERAMDPQVAKAQQNLPNAIAHDAAAGSQ